MQALLRGICSPSPLLPTITRHIYPNPTHTPTSKTKLNVSLCRLLFLSLIRGTPFASPPATCPPIIPPPLPPYIYTNHSLVAEAASSTIMAFTNSLAFSFVILSLLFTASHAYRGPLVGGRTDIPDVKSNTEVQEIGRFSVEEYNRSLRLRQTPAEQLLEFRQVVEAQSQVVSGIKYYLQISALQNGSERIFDSEVVVKPWLRSKHLLHFAPSRSRLNLN